jgi:hypothetical protein
MARPAGGAASTGLTAAAELALGRQFLSMLEGEMTGLGNQGAGMAKAAGADLAGRGVMGRLFQAVQEAAMEQAGKSGEQGSAQPKEIFAQAAERAAEAEAARVPEGVGKPIEARAGANPADEAQTMDPAVKTRPDAARIAGTYGGHAAKSLAGFLSARFESGSDPAAVGFDRMGGTSYGAFQIASRTGTMDRFLDFLDDRAPEFAARLREAGPADTGSREGGMPGAWKELAAEDPDGFFGLQYDFIKKSHLEPAARWIAEQTGVDVLSRNPALTEVLFSTAVQHGPSGSAAIFARAVDEAMGSTGLEFDKALIKGVYKNRAGQFGSSTEQVRDAVQSRLSREENMALSLLGAGSLLDASV